jgi:hypothetical protein
MSGRAGQTATISKLQHAEPLKLQMVTPEGIVYCEDVEMVGIRSVDGQIGILPITPG